MIECGFATPLPGVSNPELQSSCVFNGKVTWNYLLNLSLWRLFNGRIMSQNLIVFLSFILVGMIAAFNNHDFIFKIVYLLNQILKFNLSDFHIWEWKFIGVYC